MIASGLWPLVGAARMRALDAHTITDLGVPGEVLMESAGRAVVDALCELEGAARARAPEQRALSARSVDVVCGAGHNGGDGLVVARHLHMLGERVRVHLVAADPGRLGEVVAAQLERARRVGVEIVHSDDGALGLDACVVVDALFGTGLARNVEGAPARAIRSIADARGDGSRVVSIDLPSGIDADTGAVLGFAVAADATVTISLPKPGLLLHPGRAHAGRVFVARIGIADALPGDAALVAATPIVWTRSGIAHALPSRPAAGHKGRFGHVLVVAGSEGKTGAAALAARAAMRSGAGLVTLACAHGLNDILEVKCTEVMTAPVGRAGARQLGDDALETLQALAAERDALALGPGIGVDAATVRLVRALCESIGAPMVLDADGLNALGRDLSLLKGRPGRTVLTPHPGEAARLLGTSPAEINADRIGAARALADASAAVVVLKGASTVVADVDGRVCVNPTGNASLASGGTGDVLTGVVAAHLAQGLDPFVAAASAVYLHGAAADAWSERHGDSGLAASDLVDALPQTAARLRAREAVGPDAIASDLASGAEGGARGPRTLVPFPFG